VFTRVTKGPHNAVCGTASCSTLKSFARAHTHTNARAHTNATHTNCPVTHTYTRTPPPFFRCKGAVELVDASEMLPDLERRPGWKTWKVLDEELNEW
jgi:hypothetical protein